MRVQTAALLRVEGVVATIQETATTWVKEQLDQFRAEILNTTGAARDAYTRVKEQTTSPEDVTVELRANERAATKDRGGEDLPRYPGHLFADGDGQFPVELNDWERRVVEAEVDRPGSVARYRNPGSATPASLRIAYQGDEGEWASLQPDFIIVSRRTDGTLGAAIVDPHGDYLADAIRCAKVASKRGDIGPEVPIRYDDAERCRIQHGSGTSAGTPVAYRAFRSPNAVANATSTIPLS